MTSTEDPLAEARALESQLRADLAAAIAAQRFAIAESERLEGRAALPGALADVAEAASAQRARAESLAEEIDALRARLRAQEAVVVRLEVEHDAR